MLFNQKKANQSMEDNGLEGLIASTQGNVAYLTEFFTPPIIKFHPGDHQCYAVYPHKKYDEAILIIPDADLSIVALQPIPIKNIYTYGKYNVERLENAYLSKAEKRLYNFINNCPNFPSPEEALIEAIKKLGLDKSKLGLDEMGISHTNTNMVTSKLPQVKIDLAYNTWRTIRSFKTQHELELIRLSTKIAENSIKKVLEELKKGVTEKEMVSILRKTMIDNEAIPYLWFIGFGSESALTDREPTDRILQDGDLVVFDVGCNYKGYYSDIGRTAVVGSPNPRQIEYYKAIRAGQEAAINIIKPGILAKEVFQVAVKTVRNNGITQFKRHHCGHSTGIEPYDLPLITPGCEIELEEDMVVNIETPYYEMGFGGLQIEDTFIITKNGIERISKAITQELIRK